VAIEVYYHPAHEYNVDRMIESVKTSLDYYTKNFGPYQHRQVRILEFPRYASFAQSFANTIPYSEAIGFIARVEDPNEDIDYPYYVTAHEVAHQWWAHQVIGGNVQGSTMLSESLAEYSALMVMEKVYGKQQMHRFLKYDLDRYLQGRATERKKELPLLEVEGQQYIHYAKGSLAFYALRDYIGEDRLNGALRTFLERVKFQQPPYTTSLELYEELKKVTPDSLRYVLTDLFEEITLYDNRAKEATVAKRADGKYEVTLTIEAAKLRADSLGAEAPVPMNDLVDVGVFAENPKEEKELGAPLYLQKQRVKSGPSTVKIVVDQPPARAGIDPYHKLIDRNSDDNTVAVK
jgi:aminopeptidase N